MNKTSHKVAAAGLSVALIMGPGLAATADDHTGPPQHVLDKAIEGLGHGQARAAEMKALAATRDAVTGLPGTAQGNPEHVTGLARAQEMVTKAAERLKNNPGKAYAYGQGRASEVHQALMNIGVSPSDLPSHSTKVHQMIGAFEKFTDEKPGRGLGRNNKGDDGDE